MSYGKLLLHTGHFQLSLLPMSKEGGVRGEGQVAQVDLLGVHLQVPGGIKTLNVPALGTSEGRGGDHITCAVSKQLGPTPHLHGRDILILPS